MQLQPGSGKVSSLISSFIPAGNFSSCSVAPGLLGHGAQGCVPVLTLLGTALLLRGVLGSLLQPPSLGMD